MAIPIVPDPHGVLVRGARWSVGPMPLVHRNTNETGPGSVEWTEIPAPGTSIRLLWCLVRVLDYLLLLRDATGPWMFVVIMLGHGSGAHPDDSGEKQGKENRH
jgi:hypothetical protein